MRTTDLSISSNGARLAAALTLPDAEDRPPLVVCLHGTGPMDRDQNMPGQTLDIFNTIAEHLASAGVACLRYDKRGCGESTGDYFEAGHHDLLGDAVAVLDHARGMPECSRVFLLGHSEGTLLAVEASLQRPVDGLVLLSPFIQDLDVVLRRQAHLIERAVAVMPGWQGILYRASARLTGSHVRAQEKLIAKLRASTVPSFGRGARRVPAKALREMLALDIAALYEQVSVPALVLGGAKDLQCDPADVQLIADRLGVLATPVLLPDLTHVLRRDPGEHTFFSYPSLIQQPMDPEVCERISSWLVGQIGTG